MCRLAWSSNFDCLALLDLDAFLGRTQPLLSEPEQTLVFSICTDLQGHSPEVPHLLLMLGPILCRKNECRHRVDKILKKSDKSCAVSQAPVARKSS